MISKRTGKEVIVDDVTLDYTFDNQEKGYKGFCLNWTGNLGFGQMTFIKKDDELKVETECMSDNEDKEFIKLVLDKFIEKLNVVE